MATYSLLIAGGRVVDPLNGVDRVADVALDGGAVAEVGPELPQHRAKQVIAVAGRVVIPGIVDPHAHMSGYFGADVGYRMMARVGVTTALEMAGEPDDVIAGLATAGSGLQAACMFPLVPGNTLSGPDPDRAELRRAIEAALARGALGIKLLGGHFPLTPESSAAAIEICAEIGCHVASHAGTTATGSNVRGLQEMAELAGGRRLQIAHVNSYCRGQVLDDPVEEAQLAIGVLARHPNLVSEAYMAKINGTSALVQAGVPASNVTKTCLTMGGFPATEAGLEAAIRAGWGQIQTVAGGETVLIAGDEAVRLWREQGTDCGLSFPVNSPESSLLLAVARVPRPDEGQRTNDEAVRLHSSFVVRRSSAWGRFAVDAFSTDGGSIPRNTIVAQGLPLVRWGALSLADFVLKASLNPARILGLPAKGHLSPGADADVTVLDLERLEPALAVSAGRVIMVDGVVVGSGGTLLTSRLGAAHARAGGGCRVVPSIGEQRGEAVPSRAAG